MFDRIIIRRSFRDENAAARGVSYKSRTRIDDLRSLGTIFFVLSMVFVVLQIRGYFKAKWFYNCMLWKFLLIRKEIYPGYELFSTQIQLEFYLVVYYSGEIF